MSMPPPPPSMPPPPMGGPMGGPLGGANLPGPLAEWPQRALGGLIDFVGPAILVSLLNLSGSATLAAVLGLAALAWALYNGWLNGTTGVSIGKKVVGLKCVEEATGQVMGSGGRGILRYFAHIVDAIICYIGFLFPLWDAKRQTLADKIVKTVVVNG